MVGWAKNGLLRSEVTMICSLRCRQLLVGLYWQVSRAGREQCGDMVQVAYVMLPRHGAI